jgi:anti-sigma B factor antagonist
MHSDWLSLSVDQDEDATVVRIAGELDLAGAPELDAVLAQLSGPVVVDCQDLTFIDASGIGVIARALRGNSELAIRGLSPQVRRVFEAVGMLDLVSSED